MKLTLAALMAVLAGAHDAEASSCIPGFDYAIFTSGTQSIENHATTDSYDSSVASYSAGGCSGNLGTNSGASGAVALQNHATVCGTITTGAGGTVTTSAVASYTTPAKMLTSPVTLTAVTAPSLPSGGSASFSDNAIHVLTPGKSYSTISCSGPHTVIQLPAGTYVAGGVTMTQCALEVTGPVVVYLTGVLDVSTNATINAPSISDAGLPTNLIFLGTSAATDVHLYSSVVVYAGIYTPAAHEIHIEQHSELYGAGVAMTFHGENYGMIHYDQALATMGAGGFACTATEVSRASPVVATISGSAAVVQGTFETPTSSKKTITTTGDVASFVFPYIKGHMRARTAVSISTTATTFSSGTVLFDAAATGKIPSSVYSGCSTYTGSCRHVFTNVPGKGRTWHPATLDLDDTNASTIGAVIAPASAVTGIGASHWQTIVRAILDAKLGGVDRSTVAVIGASTFAGSAGRPTIAYFGATDGMVHAVCASVGGICSSLGTELWAFLPGNQLASIRSNAQRVDGSVSVSDAFGDFAHDPASSTRSWHTILTFSTGGSTPGTYALDVTDPGSPLLLWEYTTPASPASQDFGTGLYVALGATHINGQPINLAAAETNNGGTGGAGVVVTAFQLETGSTLWQFTYAFPATPRGGAGDLPYPTTGVPGGAVAVDLDGGGDVTDVVLGDLYGDVWRLDAANGSSATGTGTPLFSFSSDKHPLGTIPAIYKSNGAQYAAFASGGYADPSSASWSVASQYVIAVKLKPTGSVFPTSEGAATCSTCNLMLAQALTGTKGFGQALVVGTQLFVTSDSADVDASSYGGTTADTGSMMTVDLATSSATTVVVHSGAGSLASSGTTLYSSSSNRQQQLTAAAAGTAGPSVDVTAQPKVTRNLWLRTR